MIRRTRQGKFQLMSKDGKRVLGTHDTQGKALAQDRAIQHAIEAQKNNPKIKRDSNKKK